MDRTLEFTRKYLDKVTTTKAKDDIATMSAEIRTKLKSTELMAKATGEHAPLHDYEMSALSNLIQPVRSPGNHLFHNPFYLQYITIKVGATAEEAIAWIPSLVRFEEEDIDKAINIVVEAKNRINQY